MHIQAGSRVVLTRIPYGTANAALRLALYDSGEVVDTRENEAFVLFDTANTFGALWVDKSWLAADRRP